MRKFLGIVLLIIVLLAFLWSIHAGVVSNRSRIVMKVSEHANIQGREPITAKAYQRLLGVGIDVDWMSFNWVNHYYFQWRSRGVNVPEYFRREGFSNVRIRVSENVVTNKTALTQLGEVVNDTLKAGLVPVITYTAPELRVNPTSKSAQEHFVQWWKTVAHYFKGYPYILSYDLLIESSGNVKNYPGVLNRVYSQTIREIRAVDPYRIVFVTPADVSSPFCLNELNVTNDGYTLVEWHIYAGGPKYCTYNEGYIEEAVSAVLNWSKRTGIPTWLGAWRPTVYPRISGRSPTPSCPVGLELAFSRAMVSALSKAGIPYDINADTRFFDIETLTWYPSEREVLEIILRYHPPRREQ